MNVRKHQIKTCRLNLVSYFILVLLEIKPNIPDWRVRQIVFLFDITKTESLYGISLTVIILTSSESCHSVATPVCNVTKLLLH